MDALITLVGRFHPLVVHLPIGMLVLAYILQVAGLSKKYSAMAAAATPALVIGFMFSALAVVTGYSLSQEGGYPDELLTIHQRWAWVTLILAAVVTVFYVYATAAAVSGTWKLVVFTAMIISLSVTGHFGGTLTHGDDYLTLAPDQPSQDAVWPALLAANVDSVDLYDGAIAPLLSAKCYSCHSSRKQKGNLRLDSKAAIATGGKHGAVLDPVQPDSSELLRRIMLPLTDDAHMPPEGKPQLTDLEKDLLNVWIAEGAPFGKMIMRYKHPDAVKMVLADIQSESLEIPTWVPEVEVPPADRATVDLLRARNIMVTPVARGSNYLMVSFVNERQPDKSDFDHLLRLADQVVWLDLSHAEMDSEQLRALGKLKSLIFLSMRKVKINGPDNSIAPLTTITTLQQLNIAESGLAIPDPAVFSKMPNLKAVYAYKVAIPRVRGGGVHIDSGHYQLPVLATDTLVYRREM